MLEARSSNQMKLRLQVVYEGKELAYDMPVGDGRMTIKWLGLAAAQYFSSTMKPRGYRRHREKAGPGKSISASAKLLPSRVYTAKARAAGSSTFLHPEKSISEELRPGEEVSVVLTNKMAVNQLGRPIRERWMFIAFSLGDQTEEERNKAITAEYRAMANAQAKQEREAEARAADLAAKKGAAMRRMMVSQLYCPDKVERAFDRDWAQLCHPVLQPIDRITEDLEEQSNVKDVLLSHYVALVEVFKHYASVGSALSTGQIDIMEFSAFMHDLRGFSASKSRDLIEKSFNEAIMICRGDKTAGTMGVIDFLFCVIRLATARHLSNTSSIGGSGAATGESGSGSSKIRMAGSVHEAVDLFMESAMLPLAHRRVIGLQIKTALDSDEILALYHDHDASLKSIFDKYCTAGDRAGGPEALGVLLNIAEFRMILRDSGLLGGNNKEDDELTAKEARQAFAGAQNDLCGGDPQGPPAPGAGPQIEQMTYPEFLEGIARVAMLKWEGASSTPKDKIERAIAAVVSLLDQGRS
eukprot:g15900.t1